MPRKLSMAQSKTARDNRTGRRHPIPVVLDRHFIPCLQRRRTVIHCHPVRCPFYFCRVEHDNNRHEPHSVGHTRVYRIIEPLLTRRNSGEVLKFDRFRTVISSSITPFDLWTYPSLSLANRTTHPALLLSGMMFRKWRSQG
jgi:hypothetical protein